MALDNYDVMFTIASGANAGSYGFMLTTPKDATKQLSIKEVGGPNVERVRTETEASYSDFNPEQDTPFASMYFMGGLGQLELDFADPSAYLWGSKVITHVPGKVFLAPPVTERTMASGTGIVTGWYHWQSAAGTPYTFAWAGTRLYRRPDNTTDNWTLVYTASFAITDFVVFNGVGVICTPSSTTGTEDFFTQADPTAAATWTPTARNHTPFSNGTKPKYVAASRGTLFAAVDYGKVYYTVDPTQDGWVGPLTVTVGSLTGNNVGDSSHAFAHLKAVNDYMFAFRLDAGYAIDSNQAISEVIWQWKDRPANTNFTFLAAGSDNLYFSVGKEVFSYDPTTGLVDDLGLTRMGSFSVETIVGLAADQQSVYVMLRGKVPAIRSATYYVLLRGWKTSGRWAFENLWEEEDVGTIAYWNVAAVPSSVGTRVYLFRIDGSGNATSYSMDVPHNWDASTGTSFATSGVLYTSINRANFPDFSKRALWISMLTENTTSATFKVAVAYSLDNGATFTALGDTGAGGSGVLSTKLDYSGVNGRSIVLRFTFTSDGTTKTPILRVFAHHQRVRFRYLEQVSAALRVDDFIEKNNGAGRGRSVATLRADLRKLRQEEGDITYEDFLGNSFKVSFDKYEYRPSRHEQPHSRNELEAMVVCHRADSGV